MIRKILMVAIAVFFSYDIQIQSLLATLLVVVALCVHALACPYVTDAMDGLELLSLFGSFCTYFFGQFLFTESVGPAGRSIVSFIIVCVNICVVLALVLMVAGKGFGTVARIGAKLRDIMCCRRNGSGSNSNSQQQAVADDSEEEEKQSDDIDKYLYQTRTKRKKSRYKNAEQDDSKYNQINESQSASPARQSRDIKLSSDQQPNIPLDSNDVPMTKHRE
eukprot:TRINITY_DN9529_c0_g1_i1.p1 TRINITY_DN9529_c0_g1~~TRINITY_DN9529_c0_g1_i1.p1  ORF type:complete len:220 (+),score=11.28 TRINITY_DN9529_c0_g1_i1:178-837(+)